MSPLPLICIVDDEPDVRESLAMLLRRSGYEVQTFAGGQELLDALPAIKSACILADVRMPGMNGSELQERLGTARPDLPVIIMTGHGDVPLAVQAMKSGAVDFLEKPFEKDVLLDGVRKAFDRAPAGAPSQTASLGIGELTDREKDVFKLLAAGHPNKVIAHMLGISPRTVEVHRARVMEKTRARNLADLVRMSLGDSPGS